MTAAETPLGAAPVIALTTFPAPGLLRELAAAGVGEVVSVEHENLLDEVLDELPSAPVDAGLLWCWARLEELWQDLPLPMVDPLRDYVDAALELADAVLDLSRRRECPLVYVLPAIPADRPLGVGDANTTSGVVATATAVREALRSRLAGHRGVHLVDLEEDVRQLGLAAGTEELHRALARRTAALVALVRTARPRVAIVEAGAGLEARRLLLEWRRAGVTLVECGAGAPDGALRPHHFAATRTGSWTVEEVAKENGVRGVEVVVVNAATRLTDRLPPDATDRLRLRGERSHAGAADLGVEVSLRPVAEDDAIDHLLVAGHPFELNGWGVGRAELAVLAGQLTVRLVELRDLDGDHGVVGLVVVRPVDTAAELVAFRLTGAAAGKGVEQRVFAEIRALGGGRTVVVPDLGDNEPAARFFGELGFGGSGG